MPVALDYEISPATIDDSMHYQRRYVSEKARKGHNIAHARTPTCQWSDSDGVTVTHKGRHALTSSAKAEGTALRQDSLHKLKKVRI